MTEGESLPPERQYALMEKIAPAAGLYAHHLWSGRIYYIQLQNGDLFMVTDFTHTYWKTLSGPEWKIENI